jgi:hypothetical protein
MENYRDLCEEMIRIDHQPRELITDHACLELSRCLRKKGFVPIYHCLQAEGTGPTLKFAMSCYLHGFLTTDRVLNFLFRKVAENNLFFENQVREIQSKLSRTSPPKKF